MRISDWSSDVCSSDLFGEQLAAVKFVLPELEALRGAILNHAVAAGTLDGPSLTSQLHRAGYGATVESILRPKIYMIAACARVGADTARVRQDRKSTRLNSSH